MERVKKLALENVKEEVSLITKLQNARDKGIITEKK